MPKTRIFLLRICRRHYESSLS